MTLLSHRREVNEFRKRYKWMALVATLAFLVLLSRAVHLEIIDYDRWNQNAIDNITKTVTLPATRGIIRDEKGRVIATNRPSYNVYITPSLLKSDRDLPRLAELMNLSEKERADLVRKIEKVPEQRRTHQIVAFTDITREQLAALETHQSEFRGVDVVTVPVRNYPFAMLGAHVVGYLNEVNAEDLEKLAGQDYHAGDAVGRSGLEKAWESYMRGKRGYRRVLVDSRGQSSDAEAHREERVEPVPGRDLTLTLDMELMRIIEHAFRGQQSGGAVVVDVHTGRVRALFSKPSYDLNELTGHLSIARATEIQNNPLRPLIDKTIYESYFPGSTFKVFSALSALGDHILTPSDKVDCPGYYDFGGRRFKCGHAHGETDMRAALTQSCNTYFWDLARKVGIDRLARYAHELGLGDRTGIGINTETSGFIPTYGWYAEHYGNQFRGGFTLNEAIGQGNTRVSLIQLALAYAAIANGGTLYVPELVERVSSPDGAVIEEFPPRIRRHASVSPQDLQVVIDGLYGVVNDPRGSAYGARIDGGIRIAGKTGTAQVEHHATAIDEEHPEENWYESRSHAWFAGFAPVDNPELAIVVLVEHGGYGGKNAAPIAIQALDEYLRSAEYAEKAKNQAIIASTSARTRVHPPRIVHHPHVPGAHRTPRAPHAAPARRAPANSRRGH